MAKQTIGFGVILVLLGLGAYFGTGQVSVTAMIPAFFGLPLLILGVVALKESVRKHAMHVAALLGLVGLVAPLIRLIKGLSSEASSLAAAVQLAMVVVCGLFLGLCVRSFLQARRQRTAE